MTTSEKIINSLNPLLISPKYVFTDTGNINKLAKELLSLEIPKWDNDLQYVGTAEETAQYYFFLDSINFCFWAPKDKERWKYMINGERVSGYFAYSRAIKDAFIRDYRFFDSEYLSNIPEKDFRDIFKGESELLLMDKRLTIIRENFKILKEKFGGKALNIIIQAENDTDKFVELLIENFPSFRDIVEYDGKQLYFLKRAQIFPSDLSFVGINDLKFSKLDHLTVFADYRLPQLLEEFGVLKYSEELNSDILNEHIIPAGSLKEIELRASSIVAIEQIKMELIKLGRNIQTNELDWILWMKAKNAEFKKPHHKTLTTFY